MKMKQLFILKECIGVVKNPSDLFNKVRKINIDHKQENMIVVFLDNKLQMIHSEVVFKGGLNACYVDPRTIFRKALEKNAAKIILAHNHPSGCLEPSDEDRQVFNLMKEAGQMINIIVMDFIIFNEKEYFSLD